MTKVAVFAYAAGIDSFHRNDRKLIEILVESGFEPTIVQCNGILSSSCPVMKADGITSPDDRRKFLVCKRCKSAAKKLRKDFSELKFTNIETLLSNDSLDEHRKSLSSTDSNNATLYLDWSRTLYEDLHLLKCSIIQLTENYPRLVRASVDSANKTYLAAKRFFSSDNYQAAFVNHAVYGTNLAIWEAAKTSRVATYNVVGVSDPLFRNILVQIENKLIPRMDSEKLTAWEKFAQFKLGADEIKRVYDYLWVNIFSNRVFNYSLASSPPTARKVLDKLELKETENVALVLLSSPDERIAASSTGEIKTSESDWNQNSIRKFIKLVIETAYIRPEITFVIRIHPRMGSNYREKSVSPFLEKTIELLADCPSNVVVDHPSMNISLYDLAAVTTCVLTIGSTAGLNLAALGIPVVLCDPSFDWQIPSNVYYKVATQPHELDEAITTVQDFDAVENSIKAFRFLSFHLHHRSVNSSEIDAPDDSSKKSGSNIFYNRFTQLLQSKMISIFFRKIAIKLTLKLLLLLALETTKKYKNSKVGADFQTKTRIQRLISHNESIDQQIKTNFHQIKTGPDSESAYIQSLVEKIRIRCGMRPISGSN